MVMKNDVSNIMRHRQQHVAVITFWCSSCLHWVKYRIKIWQTGIFTMLYLLKLLIH